MNGDCSDVIGDGLVVSKDNNDKQIKNGNNFSIFNGIIKNFWDKRPNTKYNKIESRNSSDVYYDLGVKPDDIALKKGEKGTK